MTTLGIFTVKVFYNYDGSFYTNGGFGKYLDEMCRSFDRVVLCCRMLGRRPPEGFYKVDHINLDYVPVPALRTELGAIVLQPLIFGRGIGIVMRSDIIHARMPDWTGVTGAFVARMFGKPCAYQIVDDWAGLARTIPWRRKFGLGIILRGALKFYDILERMVSTEQLVFAQGIAAFEKHRNGSPNAHLVLSTSHSLSDIGAVTPRCEGDELVILNVGRLNAVKNQALLIRALERLVRLGFLWKLKIIGRGEHQDQLMKLASECKVRDRVEFIGHVTHGDELWSHYDAADVFALTSVSEGTPKVVLEAMARGCPVVASRVSGVPTAVEHEQRGLLFESGDVDGLVAALMRMAQDRSLRERCQREAWAFSKLHTLEESTRFMLERVLEKWPQLAPLRRS